LWTPPKPVLKSAETKALIPNTPAVVARPAPIQPMSARIPVMETTPKTMVAETKPKMTVAESAPKEAKNPKSAEINQQLMTDILKLNSARVADQIEGVRSLGKLGPQASDAVPPLAEKLIKGEALVRREVPLALMQIGRPAKMAQSVLERALDDQDTEVRVNAARALLELSDK
jgi:HEAT repeat protein